MKYLLYGYLSDSRKNFDNNLMLLKIDEQQLKNIIFNARKLHIKLIFNKNKAIKIYDSFFNNIVNNFKLKRSSIKIFKNNYMMLYIFKSNGVDLLINKLPIDKTIKQNLYGIIYISITFGDFPIKTSSNIII